MDLQNTQAAPVDTFKELNFSQVCSYLFKGDNSLKEFSTRFEIVDIELRNNRFVLSVITINTSGIVEIFSAQTIEVQDPMGSLRIVPLDDDPTIDITVSDLGTAVISMSKLNGLDIALRPSRKRIADCLRDYLRDGEFSGVRDIFGKLQQAA